jgi:hypothetical protein
MFYFYTRPPLLYGWGYCYLDEQYLSLLPRLGRVLQTIIHTLGASILVPPNSQMWIVLTITFTSVWIKLMESIYIHKTAVQSNVFLIYIVLLHYSEMCFDSTIHLQIGIINHLWMLTSGRVLT